MTADEGCSIGLLSVFFHANAPQISPEASLMETIP